MQIRIERTAPDRMTDLYVVRFPPFDRPNRFIAFRPADIKHICGKDFELPRGGCMQTNAVLREASIGNGDLGDLIRWVNAHVDEYQPGQPSPPGTTGQDELTPAPGNPTL